MNKEKYIGEAALMDKPNKKLTLVIKDGSVTTPKIADKNVTTEKMADEAITTPKVAEQAITDSKLGDNAVVERTINEEAVTASKIASGAVETDKIADENVTNEKLAEDSVTTSKIKDESVTEDKLAELSVGTAKIKDGAVTKDKVANDSLTRDKLDPELRNTLDAATGLPEDLMETIQNVDETLKDHQSQLDDKQSQIDDKQRQITANDEDISLLQTHSTQMEETIKSIAATGGASQATAVTYDNEKSKLTAINIQSAVDEVVDKTAIKDKEGTVVETPFHYIQNEEFIFAKVDAEDKLLFGIQWDGTPVFGKTSAVEDRLQSQVTLLAEKVAIIMGDEDTTNIIDTMNELKKFFAEIENTQSLTDILTNLDNVAKNLDKTTIKDEEGNVQDTPFIVIKNEEFIMAVVDSEDRVLFGIYRATGKPYYPLNEMYHVIQNKEYFAAWLDEDDKVLLGIRRDGEIIGEIHAVNSLKQVISQLQSDVAALQEKVGIIDTNLKELLDVFSLQDNEEYLSVEKDADGKVLSATYNDGSHYIHNAKSETIPEEFEHIEDPEGRTEITTDADKKVMSYRDSSGKKHEYAMEVTNLEVSNLNLKGNSVNDIGDALKANDFKLDSPSDFSKDSYVELPIPRVAAQVRIYASKLPTTKQDDIEAEIEYNDKDGNYFRKPVILNSQGSSSISYIDKETGERGNIAIDINDGSKIKFGDFPTQDSFHLKKYYIDIFRGQCIVGYWLMEQVYQTRPIGKRYPYEMLSEESNPYTGDGKADKDFYTGAKCHPDGFPVIITWIDTKTKKEKNIGIYAWNLKKSKEVYHVNKKTSENIILDGVINDRTLFGGSVDWTQFEIRNPKSLIDIDGNKYDGDNPNELSETDKNSKKVKDYIIRLSGAKAALAGSNNKETFEKYFIVDAFIDYFIVSQILYHLDGFSKNWIWGTWNGLQWAPSLYDVDSIWGAHWTGTFIVKGSDIQGVLGTGRVLNLDTLYADEIIARYKELRDLNVFSVDNIVNLLKTWLDRIGYDNLEKEISLYSDIPSYRDPQLNEGWEIVDYSSLQSDYSSDKTYSIGDTCVYKNYKFKAIKEIINVPPLKMFYEHAPRYCGFYNSIKRVSVWLTNRISFLDKTYKYNI